MTPHKPILGRKARTERPEAQASLERLQVAVRGADRVPCRDHPEPLWISERRSEREYAALLCRACPLLEVCAEYGARESFGTWAGQDRTVLQETPTEKTSPTNTTPRKKEPIDA